MDRRAFITGLGAGLLLPGPAAAWRLPTSQLVARVNRRLARARGLQVGLVGSRVVDDRAESVGERWIFGPGKGTRVDVNGRDGATAHWARGDRESGEVGLLPDPTTRLVLSTLFGDGDLHRLLRALRVNADEGSLGLAWDQPAHVLGARPRDRQSPQVWIHARTFVVLRVRTHGPAGSYDLQLRGWEGPPVNGVFPHRVRVAQKGRPARDLEVDAARLGEG